MNEPTTCKYGNANCRSNIILTSYPAQYQECDCLGSETFIPHGKQQNAPKPMENTPHENDGKSLMSEPTCPHCGAEPVSIGGKVLTCGSETEEVSGSYRLWRSEDCYEREISALKAENAELKQERSFWIENAANVQAKSEARRRVLERNEFCKSVVSDEGNEWGICPECDCTGVHHQTCVWAQAMKEES